MSTGFDAFVQSMFCCGWSEPNDVPKKPAKSDKATKDEPDTAEVVKKDRTPPAEELAIKPAAKLKSKPKPITPPPEPPVVEEKMEVEESYLAEAQAQLEQGAAMMMTEEVTPSLEDSASVTSGGSIEYSRTQMTETEEVIETEVEETVTMMIVGVVTNPGQPGEEKITSLQEAISKGLLDFNNGVYINPITRRSIPMAEAISAGWIKMGSAKVSKSEERVKSMGIITIRTTRETMPYTVKAATNTLTGEVLTLDKAAQLHILNPVSGTYKDLKSGSLMLIGDAVDKGLVDIEYDTAATGFVQEEVLKTYSVHGVVDQQNKTKLPFHEAVSRGIIDQDSGEYVNNITGAKMSAEEAINKGFVKATLTDNPKELTLDQIGSKATQKGTEAIRKKLLNPLKALKTFKK